MLIEAHAEGNCSMTLLARGEERTPATGPPLEVVHGGHVRHAMAARSVGGETIDSHAVHGRPRPGADPDARRPAGRRAPEWLAR